MSRLHTLEGDPQTEKRIQGELAAICEAVKDAVGARLRALVLVGGYARGEGSVVAHGQVGGAYNDYDFIVVTSSADTGIDSELSRLSKQWKERVGVDVDFWHISESRIQSVPRTLFWLDVALGSAQVLAGDTNILSPLAALSARSIPLEECGRLLANRAVGLALSNLESTDRDLRRARHAHKAVLACGDSLLLAADCYRPTLRERLEQLERLKDAPAIGSELVDDFAQAVTFRRRPDQWKPPSGSFEDWYASVRMRIEKWHLRYENWRRASPQDTLSFVNWSGRLYPELPDVRPLGSAVAAVRSRWKGAASLFPWLGHPRERLARVAAALAYQPTERSARQSAARLLGLAPSDIDDLALHQGLERLLSHGN